MSLRRRSRHGAGLGVDFSGGPVVDPTENVKALSEALSQRQDDLRDLTDKLTDEKIKRMEREYIHQEKVSVLRAEFNKEIREMDAARQISVRQVDILNASATELRAGEAIKTLASQTAAIAETGRIAVANTATTMAQQLTNLFAESNKRVSALELSAGQIVGKGVGVQTSMGTITFIIGLVLGLIAIGTFVFITMRETPSATAAQPQIVYVPVPNGTGTQPIAPPVQK